MFTDIELKSLKSFKNSGAARKLHNFLEDFFPDYKKKGLLLYGPAGSGKTSMIKVGARQFGYSLVEFNSSDKRTKQDLQVVYNAVLTHGIEKKKMVLLDEIDGLTKANINFLIKILQESLCPIVLTANDKKKLMPLRSYCYFVACPKITDNNIKSILKSYIRHFSLSINEEVVERIIDYSNGDARHALTELEKIKNIDKEKALDIISIKDEDVSVSKFVEKLFLSDSEDIEQANNKITFDKMEYIINTFSENISDCSDNISVIESLFNSMRTADLFMNRIKRRQDFSLMKHIYLQFSQVIPLKRENANIKIENLSDPSFLRYFYERKKKKKVAMKLSKIYNCSLKTVLKNFVLFKKLTNGRDNLIYAIVNGRLDKEDIEYLYGKEYVKVFGEYVSDNTSSVRKVALVNVDEPKKTRKKKEVKPKTSKKVGNLSDWM